MAQQAEQTNAAAPHPLITQAIDETQLTILKGNTHPLARPEFDLGTAPASLPMERMLLVLKRGPDQETALRQLIDDQQDKNSPNYHKWMTPEQFGAQFGPTDSDMQTITTWLQSHGFQVSASKGRTVLEFSGSASQVEEAFHTSIHKYVVNGEQHWANATDPQIPTALVSAVAGVASLNNFEKRAMHEYVGRYSVKTKQLTTPVPNYTLSCQGATCYALVPYDFAAIYDLQSLWSSGVNGSGQTIAIVGRTDINPSDATTFWSLFGLSVPASKLQITVNGPDPGFTGDEAEADIDVQWSGAVAPQATVQYVESASTSTTDGVDLSALYIVDNNMAPVMSESYGACELAMGTTGNQFYNALWAQAAAQGISVFVSAGDNGSAGCDDPSGPAQYGLAVNGIASTPYNAAIGGTDFNQYNKWSSYWNSTNASGTEQSAKGYIPETTWDNSCTNPLAVTLGFGGTAEAACNNSQMLADGGVISTGGSGGPSNCVVNTQGVVGSCTAGYAKPTWQSGTGVPNDNLRDLPDVSLFASNGFMNSFYVVCQQDVTGVCDLNDFVGYGGTSVASPAFAGIMSLVNEKTGSPQGVPGFALYKLLSKQPNAFHDIPSGSTIAMPCWSGTPNCTTNTAGDTYGILSGYATTSAYDLATGLGSVDAANLVNNWTKATFTATTTTLQLNHGTAVNAVHGTAVPVNITLSPTAASGNTALLVSTGTGTTTGQAIDTFALTSGAVSGTTSMLPGGSYNVIAHYGGDGTYGGSYSTVVPVTISKENSTVALTGVATSNGVVTTVPYDAQYWEVLDVENSKGALCSPVVTDEVACPTGTVTVTSDGNPIGSGTYSLFLGHMDNSSGGTVALTGGSHTLAATYNGDNNYNSGSKSVAITVTKAGTTTSRVFTSGGTDYTQPVSLSVSVTDYSAQQYDALPTGTVTFYNGSTAISGTVTYGNNGSGLTAYLTTTFPAPGTYSISAKYNGDQNYQTSSSGTTSLILQYPAPTATITPPSQTVSAGTSITLTALIASANKTVYPTGTISFVNESQQGQLLVGPIACSNATDSSGHYACQASGTFTANASMIVEASYSGDTNYPSILSGVSQINVPDFSIAPGIQQVTVTQGQSQNVTINVTPLSGFTGTVSNFACSGLPVETTCSFNPTSIAGNGSTTLTITTTPLGQARRRASTKNPHPWWIGAQPAFLLGICLLGVPAWRKRRGAPLVLMMVAVLVLLPSCGGSGGGGGGGQQNNPVPAISALNPSQIAAGSQAQALTINGSGFMGSSSVTYNGVSHSATYMSSSQLGIQLSSGDIASTGQFPVVVTNPSPGGGSSPASNLAVVTGTPTGTFNVTVSATSGSLTHTTNLNVTVQAAQ